MPLEDYLGLLRQIAPAAESGARNYLAAYLLRCGREMTTAELRRLFSSSTGDPVLNGFVRAAQLGDPAPRIQLAQRLQCTPGAAR